MSPNERTLLSSLAVLGAMGMARPIRVHTYSKPERSNYGPKGKKNSRKNKRKK